MNRPKVLIKKSYAFTFAGGPGGHISVTDDERAVLVHSRHTDNRIEFQIFVAKPDETAEEQAKKYVLEKIDANAKIFEDPFLDLTNWLLQNS
jgi:hypothetical protein